MRRARRTAGMNARVTTAPCCRGHTPSKPSAAPRRAPVDQTRGAGLAPTSFAPKGDPCPRNLNTLLDSFCAMNWNCCAASASLAAAPRRVCRSFGAPGSIACQRAAICSRGQWADPGPTQHNDRLNAHREFLWRPYAGVAPADWHSYASMTLLGVMVPSETGYLFLLVIGFLSLAATVAVAVSAYSWRRGRKSEQPRAWHSPLTHRRR